MIQINEKFKPLFQEKEGIRYYIITGGRGSAKSFSTSLFCNLKTFEKKNRILFTRYTLTSANVSIIPEFIEKIELLNAHNDFQVTKDQIINTKTGSDILFRGIKTSSGNQTANLKSLQGVNVWVVDEAEELTDENTFDKIDLSIRSKDANNIVILILNPTFREHWIYKRFFEERGVPDGFNGYIEDTCYIHTNYIDNKQNLSDSFLAIAEKVKHQNIEKYNHQFLGAWLESLEGTVFSNWIYDKFDDSLPFIYGLDFGYTNDPTALVKVAVDTKKEVIYLKCLVYEQHLTTVNIANKLHDNTLKDVLIIADCAEPRLIDELSATGFNIIACTKGADSVRKGIMDMTSYKIIIEQDDVNLSKELRYYVWNDKRSGVPKDNYNHAIDASRYAFQYINDEQEIEFY